ncbi:hypothetical protein M0G74_05730 [Microbulbifer sp. CAU 1566]|uniref:helix-turn-helix transcriptional regulator n=1 Tax=Microbulbifer sp. CAU 1566 TaxID=2933269 RepID=UPI002005030E|nr:hypothetical protein [Microbulbifer sp. CAU 1566]MCK7596771.1 hypothetical protein [Microbulbifer sp. CAU 1566]
MASVLEQEHSLILALYGSLTNRSGFHAFLEAQICESLANGQDIQTIADFRGRSVATVRNQLKKIFEKTGCTRQGELISRILSALLR